MKALGVIGVGAMGSALVKGMLNKNVLDKGMITVSDLNSAQAQAFAAETGVTYSLSNAELVENSESIILAVKPDIVPTVISEIKSKLNRSKILISIALGVSLENLSGMIGDSARLVRCMPNTPALVNEGMTCIAIGSDIEETEKAMINKYFSAVGRVEFMPEKLLSKITSLTSSSPAYVFMLIEAMADGAVLSGVPRSVAYKLAAQAVLGSAKMLLDTQKHPGELKDSVCSPAGSTIEAVKSLEKSGFRSAIIEAMHECEKKVVKIAKQMNKAMH